MTVNNKKMSKIDPKNRDLYLTTSEAAALIGIKRKAFSNMLARGRFPAIREVAANRHGFSYLVRKEDVVKAVVKAAVRRNGKAAAHASPAPVAEAKEQTTVLVDVANPVARLKDDAMFLNNLADTISGHIAGLQRLVAETYRAATDTENLRSRVLKSLRAEFEALTKD